MKRSPIRDISSMLRSFHYAAYAALLGQVPRVRPEDFPMLEPWAQFWYHWVCVAFLQGYFAATSAAGILPKQETELRVLLDAYLLEKALYEVSYELNSRPDWLIVPLRGILQLLDLRFDYF
jgi:maltose alpha-D-glucosyltransferase/alpha-amylase